MMKQSHLQVSKTLLSEHLLFVNNFTNHIDTRSDVSTIGVFNPLKLFFNQQSLKFQPKGFYVPFPLKLHFFHTDVSKSSNEI